MTKEKEKKYLQNLLPISFELRKRTPTNELIRSTLILTVTTPIVQSSFFPNFEYSKKILCLDGCETLNK